MSIYGGSIVVLRQRDDCFADDTRDNSFVRSDGAQPGPNSNVDGHLLQHRWCFVRFLKLFNALQMFIFVISFLQDPSR